MIFFFVRYTLRFYNGSQNILNIKWRILSRTSTEQSGKNEKKKLPTGLQVHLEDMF